MTKLYTAVVMAGVLALTGCSLSKDQVLTKEAKVYSKTKAVYCGADKVVAYFESEEFITVSCADGSVKTIFFDE